MQTHEPNAAGVAQSNADDPGEALLQEWLSRGALAKELGLSIDTLQRWETRRIGPPCVRIGRKVLYRKGAIRDWLRDQEARKMPIRRRD